MTTIQGELVGALTLMTSQTVSMLRHHPAHLSALLQQYVKQQGSGDATNAVTNKDASTVQEAAAWILQIDMDEQLCMIYKVHIIKWYYLKLHFGHLYAIVVGKQIVFL